MRVRACAHACVLLTLYSVDCHAASVITVRMLPQPCRGAAMCWRFVLQWPQPTQAVTSQLLLLAPGFCCRRDPPTGYATAACTQELSMEWCMMMVRLCLLSLPLQKGRMLLLPLPLLLRPCSGWQRAPVGHAHAHAATAPPAARRPHHRAERRGREAGAAASQHLTVSLPGSLLLCATHGLHRCRGALVCGHLLLPTCIALTRCTQQARWVAGRGVVHEKASSEDGPCWVASRTSPPRPARPARPPAFPPATGVGAARTRCTAVLLCCRPSPLATTLRTTSRPRTRGPSSASPSAPTAPSLRQV